MSHKRLDLALIFLAGLVVNGLAALLASQPGYMDAYYYFGGALQLARGQGFVEPYLWNYLDPVLRLPHPSHLYWMPLASLVAAPFVALAERLGGAGLSNTALFRAAQVPFVLAAALLPLVSYAVAALVSGRRRHAVAAALLTIFSAFYLPFWAQTDAFALFGLAGAGALVGGYLGVRRASGRWLFVAGLAAGLAHLARADGVLVLAMVLGAGLWNAGRSAWRPPASFRGGLRALAPLAWVLAGYLLIMSPWFGRNLLVMGAPLVPGGLRMVWLTNYNDLFNYPADNLTPARFLAAGWGAIGRDKWGAVQTNFGNVVGPLSSIVAFPFAVAGLWQLRRHGLFVLAGLYGLLLFGAMTLLFTFAGARGSFFHSGAALLPFSFLAAVVGLDAAVEAAARRLKHWQPEKSKPVFTVLLVICAIGVTGLVALRRSGDAAQTEDVYAEVGAWLARANAPEAVVAVNNPPAFYYFTGHPSIVIPNGGPADLLRAVHDFGARWVVLDVNVPDGLSDLYAHPDSIAALNLHVTLTGAAGQPVYVFEVEP
jgi:hypothetical protein